MGRRNRDLPRLYLIADVGAAERYDVDLVEAVEAFVEAGGQMVSLRPGDTGDDHLLDMGRKLSGLLATTTGIFLMHRRAELARQLNAKGVHLSSQGPGKEELEELMGEAAIAGRSCHNGAEVVAWAEAGGDFATLGPLFSSISKPGYGPRLEVDEFSSITASTSLKVYALGGVLPEHVETCLGAGAAGVAVVGGILGATSVFDATRRYLTAIEAALRAQE